EHTPMYDHIKGAVDALRRTPSEYFARNCYFAGPLDLRQAYDAGVANLMWGADFPHSEGTHPYSKEAIRKLLWDVPESDLDAMLSTRAIELYDFDPAALRAVADRIGPTVAELQSPLALEEHPRYPQDTRCGTFRIVA